jgi:threonine dehydratase
VQVVGVQPEQNCAMHASLALGRALVTYDGGPTAAEGCAGAVAERTFRLAAAHVHEIALVSEASIRGAVAHCFRALGQIVECSGAVPVAALLDGRVTPAADGETVVVVGGGNIDDEHLDEILRAHP